MATYNGTLTKTLSNGDKHHIYPKTTAEIVKYGSTNVKATLDIITGNSSTSGSMNNKIATTYATTTSVGTVQIGNNISVSNAGVISVANASTSAKGVVQLTNAVDNTSETLAATAKAAKTAYDAAVLVMTGADGTNAGTSGRVPAPAADQNYKFLRGDGQWVTVFGEHTSNTPIYSSDDYGTKLFSFVDDNGTEFAYFDQYGNFYVTGNVYAANMPSSAS